MSYAVNDKRRAACPSKKPALCIATISLALVCLIVVLVTVLVTSTSNHDSTTDSEASVASAPSDDDLSNANSTTNVTGAGSHKETPLRETTTSPIAHESHSAVVELECYRIVGIQEARAYVFKGIPYAEPPVGRLRWKPPKPLRPGSSDICNTTINATKFGDKCFQRSFSNTPFEGSEDCLFLNIWTPTLNSSMNLPVMVYIHGGSLISLDGATPTMAPTPEIAVSGNVVFVSINYRLNAFGFLALDLLSANSSTNSSGNYGFMDQILALQWVQENIKDFGGNPDSVTLFGQSSGATSVFALLGSPMARGLFHRAWLSSGSVILNKTLEEASNINLIYLNNTGCSSAACLYQLTAEQVLKAAPWDVYPNWEGADLTDLPIKGNFNGPLAIADGTTSHEVDLFGVPDGIKTWNWTEYETNVRQRLDSFGSNISNLALSFYPSGNQTDPEFQYTSMVSDLRETCPVRHQAAVMANASSAPVYRYVVTARPSKIVPYFLPSFQPAYAFHTTELLAFFGTLGVYINPMSPTDIEFQNTVQKEIFSFVRTGNVSLDIWQPFPKTTALLDSNITIVSDYNKAQCDFWDKNGFFSYAWIN